MKSKGFRSFVAMLAMVSMLLENTATVFAVDVDNYTAEQAAETLEYSEPSDSGQAETSAESSAGTETPETAGEQADTESYVNNEAVSDTDTGVTADTSSVEISQESAAGDTAQAVTDEADTGNGQDASEASNDAGSSSIDDTETQNGGIGVQPVVELTSGEGTDASGTGSEAQTAKASESVEVKDGNSIEVSGYKSIPLYVDTNQMNGTDSFSIRIEAPEGAVYSEKLNGTLSKSDSNVYSFEGLNGGSLKAEAYGLSEGMTAEYKVRNDGYPQITLISAAEPEAVKALKVTEDGKAVEGSGLKELTITADASSLRSGSSYSLFITSDAEVTFEGRKVENALTGLDRSTGTVFLSGLDNKPFTIYVVGESENTIAADYTIASVDNGAVRIRIYDSGSVQAVKRVYTYEDELVNVTATLERADAIPDDAYFSVTQIMPGSKEHDYDAYMDALNENSAEDMTYTKENTLLYDIAFYTDESKKEEIEPEEGAVSVSIQFKQGQFGKDEGTAAEELEVNHFYVDTESESETAVSVETLDTSSDSETGKVEFRTDNFSVFSATYTGSPEYFSSYTDDGVTFTVTIPESEFTRLGLNSGDYSLKVIKRDRPDWSDHSASDAVKEAIDRGDVTEYSSADIKDIYVYELWIADQWGSFKYSLNDFEKVVLKAEFAGKQLSSNNSLGKNSVTAVQITMDPGNYKNDDQYNPTFVRWGYNKDTITVARAADDTVFGTGSDDVRLKISGASDAGIVVLNRELEKLPFNADSNINRYKVTFDSTGGSDVSGQTVAKGGNARKPADPVREGYEFAGWYDGNSAYDFSTSVSADLALTAHWNELASYTVAFNTDGGSAVASQTVYEGGVAKRPENPVKSGFKLRNWLYNGEVYDFNAVVTSDLTLTAQWRDVSTDASSTFYSKKTANGTEEKWMELDLNEVDDPVDLIKLLGRSWWYGITAGKWTLNGDAETNFAVEEFVYKGAQTGMDTAQTGIEKGTYDQLIEAGKVSGAAHIKEFNALITTPTEYQTGSGSDYFYGGSGASISYKTDSYENIRDRVRSMRSYVKAQAVSMVGKDSVIEYNFNFKDNESYRDHFYIDLSKDSKGNDNPDGTYYINVEAWKALKNAFAVNGQVHIKKNPGQVIVFNFPTSSTVNLNKFMVDNGWGSETDSYGIINGKSTKTDTGAATKTIIFNAPYAETVNINGSVGGVFLFPEATVNYGSTSGGWIVCKEITTTGGEWHFTNGELKEHDPDMTPTPTPTPTAAPTPTPAPEPDEVTVTVPVSKTFVDGDEWPDKIFKFILRRTGEEDKTVELGKPDGAAGQTGSAGTGGDCYTVTARIHQTPENGREDYRIQVDGKHNGDHSTNAQELVISFNQPVSYSGSNGVLKSGDGTSQLVIDFSYHNNSTENIGLGDLVVTSDDGLSVAGAELIDIGRQGGAASATINTGADARVSTGSISGITLPGTLPEEGESSTTVSYDYELLEEDPGSEYINRTGAYDVQIRVTTTVSGGRASSVYEIWYRLKGAEEYTKLGENESIPFVNEISKGSTPDSLSFGIAKAFDGDWTGKEFTFKLEGIGNAPMPKDGEGNVLDTVKATAENKTPSFAAIEFPAATGGTGNTPVTYRYKVSEVADETDASVKYDASVYEITVNVSTVRQGNNWVADAEATVTKNGSSYSSEDGRLAFNNEAVTGSLVISKRLLGDITFRCDRMGDSESVDDLVSENQTHRIQYCGDEDNYALAYKTMTVQNEDGTTVTEPRPVMYELNTPYDGRSLECLFFTDGTYSTPIDGDFYKVAETLRDDIANGRELYFITTPSDSTNDGTLSLFDRIRTGDYKIDINGGKKRDIIFLHSGVLSGLEGTYDFTVSDGKNFFDENGNVVAEDKSLISVPAWESVELNLPVGSGYTVTEVNVPDNMTVTASIDGSEAEITTEGGNASVSGLTVKAARKDEAGNKTEAVFVNSYETASLIVYKYVRPEQQGFDAYNEQSFWFKLTDSDGFEQSFSIKGGEAKIFPRLPLDTYTLIETDQNGNQLTQNDPYKIFWWGDCGVSESADALTFTLSEAGKVKRIRVANRIGTIRVNKTVVPGEGETLNDTFYITLKDDGGRYYDTDGNVSDGCVIPVEFKDVTEETTVTTVFKNLPVNGTYTVSEVKSQTDPTPVDAASADFDYVVESSGIFSVRSTAVNGLGGVLEGIPAVTADKNETTVITVNLKNTAKERGHITVRKTDEEGISLSGTEFVLEKEGMPVILTGENGSYAFASAAQGQRSEASRLVTGEDGRFEIVNLPTGHYRLTEVKPLAGYEFTEDGIWADFEINTAGGRFADSAEVSDEALVTVSGNEDEPGGTISFVNKKLTYTLRIEKTGEGSPLKGAGFTVSDGNGFVKEAETVLTGEGADQKAVAEISGLSFGVDYTYSETKVPAGYLAVEDGTFKVDAAEAGNDGAYVRTVTLDDPVITGNVLIKKSAENANGLEGARFEIRNENNQQIRVTGDKGSYSYSETGDTTELLSNEQGQVSVTGLPYGKYTVIELSAPTGYVKTGDRPVVDIDVKDETEEVSVENSTWAKGAVRFKKVDGTDKSVLTDVSFDLYKEGKSDAVRTGITPKDGYISASELSVGSYYFVETKPQTGYEITLDANDAPVHYSFEITDTVSEGTVVTIDGFEKDENGFAMIPNEREKGSITLEKKERSSTGRLLSGISFELYKVASAQDAVKSSDRPVETETTDEKGSLTFEGEDGKGLEWGYYVLKEVSNDANKKYVAENGGMTGPVYIGGTDLHKELTETNAIVNRIKKGSVLLRKQDAETKAALSGAVFSLYKDAVSEGNYIRDITVNGGEAKEVLEYGDYVLVEKTAPEGYEKDVTPHEFSINDGNLSGDVVAAEVTVENTKKTGSVTIHKWGPEVLGEGEEIKGAEFTLYSSKNHKGLGGAIQSLFNGEEYYTYGSYVLTEGVLTIDGLPWDSYFFRETEAPAGYELDNTREYAFTIGVLEDGEKKTEQLDATVNVTNKEKRGAIRLVKQDKDGEDADLSGAVFELYKVSEEEDGADERYPDDNTVFTIGEGNEVVASGLEWGTYYFKEITPPEGYQLPVGETEGESAFLRKTGTITINAENAENSPEAESNTVTFANERIYGSIDLKKVDDDGNGLSGATFYITRVDGEDETGVELEGSMGIYAYKGLYDGFLQGSRKDVIDTTGGGELTVTGLPYGTYRVYENKAPEGYKKVSAPYEYSIVNQGDRPETPYLFINSLVQAKVNFTKTGLDIENNKVGLGGAVFRLYKYETDAEGNVTGTQDLGTVTSVSGGAKAGLVEKDGLGVGKYYFIEETAPEGYEVIKNADGTDKKYSFEVTEADDGSTLTVTPNTAFGNGTGVDNTRRKGIVRLFKAGSDDPNRGLNGAQFSLYKEGNGSSPVLSGLETGKTYTVGKEGSEDGKEGYLTVKGLEWGTYYFAETLAPEGYALDAKTVYSFKVDRDSVGLVQENDSLVDKVITKDTKGQELKAVDELILGEARLVKKDKLTGKAVKGATFALFYDREGSEVTVPGYGYKSLTGQNGMISAQSGALESDGDGLVKTGKDLPAGSYYFREITAPEGYRLDSETKYKFTVSQDNMDRPIEAQAETENYEKGTAYNEPELGVVELFKYEEVSDTADGGNGTIKQKISAEAHFKLYRREKALGIIPYSASQEYYATNDDGIIRVEGLEWGEYYFVEDKAPEGYIADEKTRYEFKIEPGSLMHTVSNGNAIEVKNERKTGSIKLVKKDAQSGALLLGAEFALYRGEYGSGALVKESLVTDAKGEITVTGLTWGKYYFVEKKAPTGYNSPSADNHSDILEITAENVSASADAPLTTEVTNSMVRGNVLLTKYDDKLPTANKLAGAEFALYKEDGTRVYVNGENGSYTYSETETNVTMVTPSESSLIGTVAVTDLPYGSYYFVETEAPYGYNLNTEPVNFTISEAGNVAAAGRDGAAADDTERFVRVSCVNSEVKATVSFKKTVKEGDSEEGLAGAVFELRRENGTSYISLGEFPSGEDGTVSAGNLSAGHYYFVEKSVPGNAYNFEKDVKHPELTFEITAADNGKVKYIGSGDGHTFANTRKEGRVELNKIYKEGETTGALNGAVFKLYRMTGNTPDIREDMSTTTDILIKTGEDDETGERTTGNGGRITVSGLSWGRYYFIETSAPTGYTFDENKPYEFEISEATADRAQIIEVADKRQSGELKLHKYSSDNTAAALSGVQFRLYRKDVDGNEISVASLVTDEDGNASVSGLAWGDYYLKETAAKAGYQLDETERTFSVGPESGEGLSHEFNIANEPVYGFVELEKTDAENKSGIKGVAFDLFSGIYGSDTAVYLKTVKTDENGRISKEGFGELVYGNYYLTENEEKSDREAVRAYEFDAKPHAFSITTQGQTVSFTKGNNNRGAIENPKRKGSVRLVKKDGTEKLAGAGFTLYRTEPESLGETLASLIRDEFKVGEYTTDSNGEIYVSDLSWNDYFFVETAAPDGYEIPGYGVPDEKVKLSELDVRYRFSISKDNANDTVILQDIENVRMKGALELTKTDADTKDPIQGASFALYRISENGEAVCVNDVYNKGKDFVTGIEGRIRVENVAWGSYYFLETSPAEGYEVPATPVRSSVLTVDGSNYDAGTKTMSTQKTALTNKKGYGYVSLQKYFVAGDEDGSTGAWWNVGCDVMGDSDSVKDRFNNENHRKAFCGDETHYRIDLGYDGKPVRMHEIKTDRLGDLLCILYTDDTYTTERDISTVKAGERIYWKTFEGDNLNAARNWSHTGVISETVHISENAKDGLFFADENGEKDLSGTTFRLINEETNTLVGEYVTGKDGIITDKDGNTVIGPLEYGNYYFKEASLSARALEMGYVKSEHRAAFVINKESTKEYAEKNRLPFVNNVMDVHGNAGFKKTDKDNAARKAAGIGFKLYDSSDNLISTVYSDPEGNVSFNGLSMGSYHFVEDEETAARAGYQYDDTVYYFDITFSDNNKNVSIHEGSSRDVNGALNGPVVTEIANEELNGGISLRKLGEGGEVLRISTAENDTGAEFELWDAVNNTKIYTASELRDSTNENIVNDGQSIIVRNLSWGTYYFKETKAPEGYVLPSGDAAMTGSVTIDENNVRASAAEPIQVNMTDEAFKIFVSKADGAKELAGATLSIYRKAEDGGPEGEPLLTWITGINHKAITVGTEGLKESLKTGVAYILHEETAPSGYSIAEDVEFRIAENGAISINNAGSASLSGSGNGMTIVMKDSPIELKVSKKAWNAETEEKGLSGAHLQIREEGRSDTVASWISDGTSYSLNGKLTAGKTYVLEETKAPDGYYTTEPITFKVQADGTLLTKDDKALSGSYDPVRKEFTISDKPIRVSVAKTRLTGTEETYVAGAKFSLYEVKSDGTNGKLLISEWTSSSDAPTPLDSELLGQNLLKVGAAYRIVETKAPEGYAKAPDKIFIVDDYDKLERTDSEGLQPQLVNVRDEMLKIVISKQAAGEGRELAGAKLTLKRDGDVIASWTGTDKPAVIIPVKKDELTGEELESFSSYNIVETELLSITGEERKTLTASEEGVEYTLTESEAPAGYDLSEELTFKLRNDGSTIPSPVVVTDRPLAVAVRKVDGDGRALAGAKLRLVEKNNKDNVIAEWTSTEKPVIITEASDGEISDRYDRPDTQNGKLAAGREYTIVEVETPSEEYRKAKDQSFTLEAMDINGSYVREIEVVDPTAGYATIPVTKYWIVPRDKAGNLPADYRYEPVTISLYRDSEEKGVFDKEPIATHTLSDGTSTSFTFTVDANGNSLEEYSDQGYKYTYKIEETDVPEGFESHEGAEGRYELYNTAEEVRNARTSVKVKKRWVLFDDGSTAPQDATVVLVKDGEVVQGKSITIKASELVNGEKEVVFNDLEKYDLNTGREFTYTVKEVVTGDFVSDIRDNGDNSFEIINTPKQRQFFVRGVKTWIDPEGMTEEERPDVTIELWKDGSLYQAAKLDAENKFSFGPLVEYRKGDGNGESPDRLYPSTWEIRETGAEKYEHRITYGSTGAESFEKGLIENIDGHPMLLATIENKYKQEKISISGTKHWEDGGDYKNRPAVNIVLKADGKEAGKVEIPNTSNVYSFTNLDKYKYEDGKAKLITYTVEEERSAALAGYRIFPEDGQPVEMRYDDGVSAYTGLDFTNTPTRIQVSKKITDTDTELPGAALVLEKVEGRDRSLIANWISGNVPYYIEGLDPEATYVLTEKSAPTGYWEAESQEITVTWADADPTGEIKTFTMYDEPVTGKVELTKQDADTREILPGAEFELYTESGSKVKVVKAASQLGGVEESEAYTYAGLTSEGESARLTATHGALEVNKLPYGVYYFKEVKAPDGYDITTEDIIFSVSKATAVRAEVSEDSRDYKKSSVTFLDKKRPGKVRLTKASGDGDNLGAALSGARFELYSSKANSAMQAAAGTLYEDAYYLYGEYVTDEKGEILVEGLPWDDYYFIEVEAPDGYLRTIDSRNSDGSENDKVYTFTVDRDSVKDASPIDVNEGQAIYNYKGGDEGPTEGPTGNGGGGVTHTPTYGPTDEPGGGEGPTSGPTDEPGGGEGPTGGPTEEPGGGEGPTSGPTQAPATATPEPGPTWGPTVIPATPTVIIPSPRPNTTTVPTVIIPSPTRIIPSPEPEATTEPTEEPTPTPGVTETPTPTPGVTTTPTVLVTTVPPTATPEPTTIVAGAITSTPTRTAETPTPTPTAAVLGARRIKSESPIQGVLGVRSAPKQGVLGERVGPATGDAANIALWLIVLGASIGAIVVIIVQSSRKRRNR